MFFSIILPTFNRAHLLERAVKSVISQSFEDWELFIIDDGSIDNTESIARQLCKGGVRVRYHHSENKGAAAARNLGCSLASGSYLTFLDSDDEY